jgi:hypothetical protein
MRFVESFLAAHPTLKKLVGSSSSKGLLFVTEDYELAPNVRPPIGTPNIHDWDDWQ